MPTDVRVPAAARVFITRRPIFDREKRVFAYRLPAAPVDTATPAAQTVVDGLQSGAFDALVGERPAFVAVDRDMLAGGFAALLPKERVVLELGTDIQGEAAAGACRALSTAGFTLAVSDFVRRPLNDPLLPLARYLSVDLPSACVPEFAARVADARTGTAYILLTAVETPADVKDAITRGATYISGDFLKQPVTTAGKSVDAGALGRMRVLHALHNPMLSLTQIEDLIKTDTTIVFQVLRTVNSAAFAQRRTVESIQQALFLLGRDMIRRWISVWTLSGIGREVHPELMTVSAARARCCEMLADVARGAAIGQEAFLLGLCSTLDVVLGAPMEEIMQALPLPEASKAALLGADNRQRWLIECVAAYERGDWPRAVAEAARLGVRPSDLPSAYLAAVKWARELQTSPQR